MFYAAYHVFEKRKDILAFFSEIFGIYVIMIAALILSVIIIPEGATLSAASLFLVLRLALLSSILIPIFYWVNRSGELGAIVREVFNSRFRPK